MKKLLVFIMMAASSLSFAEGMQVREKPVYCMAFDELMENLVKNYGEEPDFISTNQMYQEYTTEVVMMRNKSSGSWTFVEYNPDKSFACILASGKDTKL